MHGLSRHAVSVCLSVCLSVTFVHSVKRVIIFSFFLPSGSQAILVFLHQSAWQYSDGNPLTGRRKQGVMKNDDFRPLSRFISQMMQDRAIVTMDGE